jgi:hypothetical protein
VPATVGRMRTVVKTLTAGILTALAPAAAANAAPAVPGLVPGLSGDDAAKVTSTANIGITTEEGDRLVKAAYDELNSDHRSETPMGSNCNFYSDYWNQGCQMWAGDFVKYIWKRADVPGWGLLTSEANSAAVYGNSVGTWHPHTAAGMFPGATVTYSTSSDALRYATHVGIYVGLVNGAPKVISGNYNNQVYKHNIHINGTMFAGWTGVG